jgi:hypothetical protein
MCSHRITSTRVTDDKGDAYTLVETCASCRQTRYVRVIPNGQETIEGSHKVGPWGGDKP